MSSTKDRKKAKKNPFRFFLYDFVKITGMIPAALILRPKYYYENEAARRKIKGRAMIIANHQSFIDPIMVQFVAGYRRIHTVATTDLLNNRLKKFFFSRMLCIPVDKKNFNMSTFRGVCEALDDEKVVAIFPEGGVHVNAEEPLQFKSGVVMMALRGRARIIPTYVEVQKKWYKRARIVIGEPIDIIKQMGGFPDMDAVNKISEALYEKELQLMNIGKTEEKKK